jgi:chromosome partitioning protein
MSAKVISFINLKGGVGKTTLALATGEILASEKRWNREMRSFYHIHKVLLIDLDGQSNLTFASLAEDEIKSCWDSKKSTFHFFASFLGYRNIGLNECICERCSNITNVRGKLHIVPSSFELFNFEERLMEAYEKGLNIDLESLRKALKAALVNENILEDYDYIIIDCPPNLSILTANAILASDYYVVPVIPEKLSTYGLNLIKRRIGELKVPYPDDVKIKYAGAVLNRIDIRRTDHIELAEQIMKDEDFKCFGYWIGDWKPLYLVTDYNIKRYENVYKKYGMGTKRKRPYDKSDLLSWSGDIDSMTADYFRVYERISGFVKELISRAT